MAEAAVHIHPRRARLLYSFWFLLLVTVLSGILAELIHLGLRETGLRDKLPPIAVVSLPALLAGAGFAYIVLRLVYRASLREFGVRWIDRSKPWLKWLIGSSILAVTLWMALWGLICAGLLAAANAGTLPDHMPSVAEFHRQNPLHMFMHGDHRPQLLAHLLHMFVIVGLAEELFGRGLLQNALDRRYLGVWGRGRFTVRTSTLLAAPLFAFWHTQWLGGWSATLSSAATSITIILLPSLLLAITYEKTRSMLVVIVLHNVIDGGKLATWYVWSLIVPA
jgi:membrane protease YdiL (CAAX protease family)